MVSLVPPPATTFGDTDGHSGAEAEPLSPDEAMKVTPLWPEGVGQMQSRLRSLESSPSPKLMETATTPGCLRAQSAAFARSLMLFVLASTRRILAAGAIACAHCTSRSIS